MSKKQRPPHANHPKQAAPPPDDQPPAWLERAASRHEARQQQLASMFDGARDSVSRKKAEAGGLFDALEDEADDAAPKVTLFDEAAQAYEQRQRQLGSMFGDAVRSRDEERAALQKMFGDRPQRGPRRGR
jgi:hypothetical protein